MQKLDVVCGQPLKTNAIIIEKFGNSILHQFQIVRGRLGIG